MNKLGNTGGVICPRCKCHRRSIEHKACSKQAQTELKPAKKAQRPTAHRTEAFALYLSKST